MIASYVILKYGGEPRPQGRPRVGHDEGQHPDRSHQLTHIRYRGAFR